MDNASTSSQSDAAGGPWYAGGLHFHCARCGRCCTGDPGYVWLRPEEIPRIAHFLRVSEDEFLATCCRKVFVRISLLEHPNGDCVFFSPAGCRIYPVRPVQCKSFPFWAQVLQNRKNWQALKARCQGVDQGPRYSRAEIEAIRDGKRATGEETRTTGEGVS